MNLISKWTIDMDKPVTYGMVGSGFEKGEKTKQLITKWMNAKVKEEREISTSRLFHLNL